MSVRERGIIFSAPMVKALLDGSKTQTRRIIKPQPTEYVTGGTFNWNGWLSFQNMPLETILDACPYGVAGDRLWVRETHAFHVCHDKSKSIAKCGSQGDLVVYRDESSNHPYFAHMRGKWRPSIHMPRWASRITLEITGVRVERLQHISEADAKAEGITSRFIGGSNQRRVFGTGDEFDHSGTAKIAYRYLWDSLYGKGACELNPWVFVLGLKKL